MPTAMGKDADVSETVSAGPRWHVIWEGPRWVLLILGLVVLVNLAGIALGALAGYLVSLTGADIGWIALSAIVCSVFGVLACTKFAFWVGEKFRRPRVKSVEEMAEVFE